jgi:hypothetical protein
MIHPQDLRELVIRPTLKAIGLWSAAAENLLIGTWYQESSIAGMTRLKQVSGPALGGYQTEPPTHKDNWDNFLRFPKQIGLRDAIMSLVPPAGFSIGGNVLDTELVWNLPYATAMARIKYYRVKEALPAADDMQGLAEYWDKHYNANPNHGFPADWIRNYPR